MLQAITLSVLAGATIAFGPEFLAYAAISYAGSCLAGAYCEEQIKEYDHAIRQQAKKASGKEQPGDACEYGKFVNKTTSELGPFFPILPLITAGAGIYFNNKKYKVESGEEYRPFAKKKELPPGFVSEGTFYY